MKTNNTFIPFLATALTLLVIGLTYTKCTKEHFTAPGLTLTRPSEWWFPKNYNPEDWIVPGFPDQLSQPECLSYNRGPTGPLNFNSYAYRYWRF